MRNALFLVSAAVLASGCVFVDNGPPVFDSVGALISLGVVPRDDVLLLDAEVFDPDGPGDVRFVYVEVFDDYSGQFVDTFDLFPVTGRLWQADVPIVQTFLDPRFYKDYSIDFIVEDFRGPGEVVTVLPDIF